MRIGCTLAELRNRMTHDELMIWAAFNQISPIGDERCHDLGHAMTRQLIVQAMGSKKQHELADFLPFRERYKPQNALDAAIYEWAKSMGATERRH